MIHVLAEGAYGTRDGRTPHTGSRILPRPIRHNLQWRKQNENSNAFVGGDGDQCIVCVRRTFASSHGHGQQSWFVYYYFLDWIDCGDVTMWARESIEQKEEISDRCNVISCNGLTTHNVLDGGSATHTCHWTFNGNEWLDWFDTYFRFRALRISAGFCTNFIQITHTHRLSWCRMMNNIDDATFVRFQKRRRRSHNLHDCTMALMGEQENQNRALIKCNQMWRYAPHQPSAIVRSFVSSTANHRNWNCALAFMSRVNWNWMLAQMC